jgi:hypothetical protein
MRQMEQVQFLKDLGLAGAALVIFYAWNQLQGDAGLSITDPPFKPRRLTHIQPFSRAIRTASIRLRAPVLPIAAER